jgi:hypothetical protein
MERKTASDIVIGGLPEDIFKWYIEEVIGKRLKKFYKIIIKEGILMYWVWYTLATICLLLSVVWFIGVWKPNVININLKPGQKPFTRKSSFTAAIIFLLLSIFFSNLVDNESSVVIKETVQPVQTKNQKQTVEKNTTDQKPLTLEEKLNKFTADSLGSTNNKNKNRIEKITVLDNITTDTSDDKVVNFILNADDGFTNEMIRDAMLMDTRKLLRELAKYKEVSLADITWKFPMLDSYGNESQQKIMSIKISDTNLQKINWDNFLYKNIPDVSDSYWEHPVLKK